MSEFRRQHPAAAIARAFDLIRGNLVTILVVLLFGSGGEGLSFLWLLLAMFFFLLLAGTAGWWRFHYRVEDGELHIRHGILVQKNIYLTRERVQVIDVTAGPVQRVFGLVKMEFKTAGASSREASLSAVNGEEARQLVSLLKKDSSDASAGPYPPFPDSETGDLRAVDSGDRDLLITEEEKGRSGGTGPGERDGLEETLPGEKKSTGLFPHPGELQQREFRPGWRKLVIAASTSGSFGIALSLLATLFSQIEPLISDTGLYETFLEYLPGEADALLILSFAGFLALSAWLLSFFGTLVQYGDFVLIRGENELVVRRGILEKKSITLPYNRIQAVRIVEGVVRQPFGYASILAESAGYGERQEEGGSVVLFPLIHRSVLEEFLRQVLPDWQMEPVEPARPPARALRRYLFRSSTAVAAVAAGGFLFLELSFWSFLMILPGLFWGWLRHRDAEASADSRRLRIRTRLLALTTTIIPGNRVQQITCRSNGFQRRSRLAHLGVSVASGGQGRTIRIQDLDREEAARLFSWLSASSHDT